MLSFILLVCGFVFYYLSYKSPRTDLILYGVSGIFFILAAIAGFVGYGDIQTAESISYTYTTVNNQSVIDTETRTPVYSGHILFTSGVPIVEFLIGLYILIVLGVEPKQLIQNESRKEQSRNKSKS